MRPYMLQPKNYAQALGQNFYRVTYRRTGTYKGMGQPIGPDPSNPIGSTVYGPTVDQLNVAGQTTLTPYGYTDIGLPYTAPGTVAAGSGTPPGAPGQSYLPWIIGGVVLIALLAGARR